MDGYQEMTQITPSSLQCGYQEMTHMTPLVAHSALSGTSGAKSWILALVMLSATKATELPSTYREMMIRRKLTLKMEVHMKLLLTMFSLKATSLAHLLS